MALSAMIFNVNPWKNEKFTPLKLTSLKEKVTFRRHISV